MTAHVSSGLDLSLKYISVRTQWGCQQVSNSIATVEDREYLMAVGNRLSLFDEDRGVSGSRSMLYAGSDVSSVVSFNVSTDKKFICACVRRTNEKWKATALVYDMDSQRSYRKPPRTLLHEDGSQRQEFSFANACFSDDSKYVACYSSRAHVGVIIFDWRVERIVSTIHTKNLITAISFNPANSTRLCVAGACGMIQFWHFTSKSVYSAPITGFNRSDVTYTAHTWMESDAVVTGTSRGTLHLIVGCEAKTYHHAFGINSGSRSTYVSVPVTHIISKGSTIIATSAEGCVCVSKYAKVEGRGGSTSIKLESFFTLQDVDVITGITWADRNLESTLFVVTSSQASRVYQLPQVDALRPVSGVTADRNGVEPAVTAIMKNSSMLKYGEGVEDTDDVESTDPTGSPSRPTMQEARVSFHHSTSSGVEMSLNAQRIATRWPYLVCQRMLTCFHSGEVKALSTTPRCSLLASLSARDMSVKLWDYNRVSESCTLTEDFSQRQNELPNAIDMHPSGFTMAAGSDDFVTEYAITDAKLEVLKRIPIKVAITSANGEPVMNTAPVSIVKFSNGGHLLAVVTGRLCQVFEVYNYNYHNEKNGVPERMMTLNDHMSNITDVTFTSDDKTLYTCAADGAVYEWTVGRSTVARDSDYVMKNVGATRVAVSPTKSCLMAAFEVESTLRPYGGRMSTLRSFSRQNSEVDSSRGSSPENTRRSGMLLSRGDSGANHQHSPLAQLLMTRASSAVSDAPLSHRSGMASLPAAKAFLVYWTQKIQSQQETVLELSHAVTAISFGVLDGRDDKEICVLGMSNGEVIISVLPIPLRVVSESHFDPSADVRIMVINSASSDRKPGRMENGGHDMIDGQDGTLSVASSGISSPNRISTPPKTTEDTKVPHTIDQACCRVFSLHEGAVTHTLVSASGLWIFTSGVDGSMFMLNTNLKAKEQIEVSEAYGNEHHIVLTDKAMLKSQQARIEDKEAMLEEMAKDKKHTILQLETQREIDKRVLEETMVREIAKRDDIILQGRTELQQANKKAAEKLEHTHKSYRTQLAELEVMYEKKLAHEALYLDNMKQAYDEYVTHARMDLEAYHRKAGLKEEKLNQEKEEVLEETEKQKKLLLEYCDYVGERHREVLANLSNHHDDEKNRLNTEMEKQVAAIEHIRNQSRQDEAKALRQMQLLRSDMNAKEMEALNTAQELERMKDRAHRLETALQNAMEEISRKSEAASKWEFKAGEQQQQLSELERVRKALVSQLHELREDMGPKDMQIVKTSERLQEVDKEYERSLKAVSEKEQKLTQSTNMIHLLHKQVRELRTAVIQKEGSLKRAAKLLDEFKYALQQARFESRKITVPGGVGSPADRDRALVEGEVSSDGFPRVGTSAALANGLSGGGKKHGKSKHDVLELISSTPVMEESLQRLYDVLNPHATDEEVTDDNDKLVIAEKERQIDLMRRNITSLRTNIKFGESVATKKVHNFLADNEHLLYEMNALRHEIGYLREENERMHATYDMFRTRRQGHKASIPKQKGRNVDTAPVNSLLPEFPIKRTDSEHSDDDLLGGPSSPANDGGNVSLTREEMIARALSREDSAKELARLAGSGSTSKGAGKDKLTDSSNLPSAATAPSGVEDPHSASTAPSSAYASRADQLVMELMASNTQRIQDQAVEREKERTRLLAAAKSAIPMYHGPVTTGRDKKKKGPKSDFTLSVGPAARNPSRAVLSGANGMVNGTKPQQSASTSALPRIP